MNIGEWNFHAHLPLPLLRCVVCTQGPGAQTPQPFGASGQLVKKASSPQGRASSFLWMKLDVVTMTVHLMNEQ